MWLLIQSCSLCVSHDYVFYIPFYLVAEAPTWSLVSLIFFPFLFLLLVSFPDNFNNLWK